ncbi:MAG: nucleotidyltransferase family protein [Desulfobacteraceae bacterium]|nr:nucleotidyltransferase family protein [Desulfobacteraceae bacterium]
MNGSENAMTKSEVNTQDIQVAILAGGLGTRLRSVISDRNKVVADVNGTPFIDYLLYRLENAGFSEVILCSGYKHEDLFARLGTHYHQMRLHYSPEPAPLGTAGALRHALPLFTSEYILVLNGDSYCDLDFERLIRQHFRQRSQATLATVWVEDTRRYGTLLISPTGELIEFQEKSSDSTNGFINAGIYLLPKLLIETIPARRALSLEQDIFPVWTKKRLITVYHHNGHFIDIGTAASYRQAQAILPSIASI